MEINLSKRLFLLATKWLPVLGSILVTIHYGIYFIFNTRSILMDFVCDASLFPTLYIISSSMLFDYCRWHRLCIGYLVIGSLLIDLHRWIPQWFTHPRIWCGAMFFVGVTLLILTLFRNKLKI